jgi:glycosyl transferase family 11
MSWLATPSRPKECINFMVVRMDGGLGNQAFEWAFGRSVSLVKNEELFFEKFELDDGIHRNYALDAFNVDVEFAEPSGERYLEKTFAYDKDVITAPSGSHFVGSWQTEKYFNEEIVRKEMTLRNPVSDRTQKIADEIVNTADSAFVHVRRGDALLPAAAVYHGVMTMDYFNKAIEHVCERVSDAKFFVFSEEPSWCSSRFPKGCRVLDCGLPHEDIWLMSLCKHAIISNSTFGWWGCWLGDTQPNRVCVAPRRWFLGAKLDYSDVVPERWTTL